jgi:hypothetical protein
MPHLERNQSNYLERLTMRELIYFNTLADTADALEYWAEFLRKGGSVEHIIKLMLWDAAKIRRITK